VGHYSSECLEKQEKDKLKKKKKTSKRVVIPERQAQTSPQPEVRADIQEQMKQEVPEEKAEPQNTIAKYW